MPPNLPVTSATIEFDTLESAVVDHLFALQPGYAVFLGLHAYDGRLPQYAAGATDPWLAEADRLLRRLGEFRAAELPGPRRPDRTLLELLLESPVFDLREGRELERNPMAYVGAVSLTAYLVRDYAPVPERVDAIARILREVPALLATGRQRLGEHLPEPFLTLTLAIGSGLSSHFAEAEAFARRGSEAMGARVAEARGPAEAAVDDFLARVRDEWTPRATPEFALGAERYQRLLWVREGIRTPFAQILEEGRRDLAQNQARLAEIAGRQRPPTSVADLLESLYLDHPSAPELVPLAQQYVAETRAFVLEQKLVSIPPPDSCRVEETPTFGRALSTASMNPPGPFDVSGDEAIYFVTPVDAAWSPDRQEEWLRSLNRSMLRNVTVHEVYPGHYLQFLHLRRSASTFAREVYLSASFTEGWAHYAEQLAIEAGLGRGSPAAEAAQLHDALLRDCRLIASIGLHTGGMTLEAATGLFQQESHFERLPAEREAIRGTYNPEYFCYTLGKLAILQARRQYLAPKFGGSLSSFHDRLLSFGCPPIGLLDELFAG